MSDYAIRAIYLDGHTTWRCITAEQMQAAVCAWNEYAAHPAYPPALLNVLKAVLPSAIARARREAMEEMKGIVTEAYYTEYGSGCDAVSAIANRLDALIAVLPEVTPAPRETEESER